MAWQRFSVELEGEGEPVDVQTAAVDWADVAFDPNKAMDSTFRVVHLALLRMEHPVPRNYRAFLEVLDGIPTLVEDDGGEAFTPTDAAPSAG